MNKASGGDGIPVDLFQTLKDDSVKVLHSVYQQIWKTQQWPQDWKRSVFIPIPKSNDKECSNYHTIVLISQASKSESVSRSLMSNSFATPWTVACQAPLFMEFSRQEYWSGLLFLSRGHLPNPGIESGLLHYRQILYRLNHQRSLLKILQASIQQYVNHELPDSSWI